MKCIVYLQAVKRRRMNKESTVWDVQRSLNKTPEKHEELLTKFQAGDPSTSNTPNTAKLKQELFRTKLSPQRKTKRINFESVTETIQEEESVVVKTNYCRFRKPKFIMC